MRVGVKAVLALVLLGALSLVPPAKAETVTVNLRIPGEIPQTNSNGQPILVAGIWHEIGITLESPATGIIALEATSLSASVWDLSSLYRWERDEANGTWADSLYGFFINSSLSTSDGTNLIFYAGIDATALEGAWRLRVFRDASMVDERFFEVEPPQPGYGLSVADFTFRVAPFTQTQVSTQTTSSYLRLLNDGNIPLRMAISFDILQERLTVINPDDVAHVSDEARYYLLLDLNPTPPQIIEINGLARVETQYIIPSQGATQIIASFENEFPAKIIVGRIGYQVETIGDTVFQTINEIQAQFNSLVAWQVFLTGSQQVSLDISVSGVRLLGVYQGSNQLTLPATLTPNPDLELPVTIQVMTDIPDFEARVTFHVTLLVTEDSRSFVTLVRVGPRAPPLLQPSHLWLFASLMSASVLALVSYNQWRLGGNGGGRRVLGKKIGRGAKPDGKSEPGQLKSKKLEGDKGRKENKENRGREKSGKGGKRGSSRQGSSKKGKAKQTKSQKGRYKTETKGAKTER